MVFALLEEDEVATEGERRVWENCCWGIGGETRTGGAVEAGFVGYVFGEYCAGACEYGAGGALPGTGFLCCGMFITAAIADVRGQIPNQKEGSGRCVPGFRQLGSGSRGRVRLLAEKSDSIACNTVRLFTSVLEV